MYLEFFQLREAPFNITPDPHYLFMSRHHREAYNHVMYGIRAVSYTHLTLPTILRV